MIGPALVDTSAWARLDSQSLSAAEKSEVQEAIEAGRITVCLPFLLEIGFAARNATAHSELYDDMLALPWAAVDNAVEMRALDAQRQLARAAHHRLPPVDVLIAALADRHGLGVLHYDHDFDVVLDKTNLRFDSIWLAEPGSL